MANVIKPKRSSVPGNTPTTSNLASGELGVNMADQKAWINNGTTVVQIASGKLTGLSDVSVASPTNGQVLQWNGSNWVNATSGAGTVTSVGGTGTVSGLTLTGTVTSSGNLTLGGTLSVTASNFASQTANTFLCAPNGAAGTPTFRTIVAADIPTLNQNTTGSSGSCTGNAATATTATNATNVAITNDTATATALYVAFVGASSGNTGVKTHSTGLTFVPSTGAFTASGNVTAYSDETLKTDWELLPANFVEMLAGVKSGTYTRKDTGERQVGCGAQSLLSVIKEAVTSNDDGILSVAYGNAALASAVELAKEVVDLKAQVKELTALCETLVKKLAV